MALTTKNIIKPETINFTELVHNNNITMSLSKEYSSKMITFLNNEFTEEEQQWYKGIYMLICIIIQLKIT
jgi:hypothetical protein